MVIDGIDRNALAIRDKVLGVIDDYGNIDGDIYPIYVGRTRVVIPSWVRVLYDGSFSQSYIARGIKDDKFKYIFWL